MVDVLCRGSALPDIVLIPEIKGQSELSLIWAVTFAALQKSTCLNLHEGSISLSALIIFLVRWGGTISSQSFLLLNLPELRELFWMLVCAWGERAQLGAVSHISQPTAMLPRRSSSTKCSCFVSDTFQSVELRTTLPRSICSPCWRMMEEEHQWMGWTGQCTSTWRRRASGR